jgi:hypothetical protein
VDEDLREAVARGLHVNNLWAIVRVCTEVLRARKLPNPIIALTIEAVCTELASVQDSQAVSGDYAELVDAHLLPAIETLLDVSSGSAHQVRDALNHSSTSCADAGVRCKICLQPHLRRTHR